MAWYDKVIAAHIAVTDSVSHIQRMKSNRYFVWEEDSRPTLYADGIAIEYAHEIVTDLFTNVEFDPWVEAFTDSLNGKYSWSYEFVEYEADTGLYHHQWTWYVHG